MYIITKFHGRRLKGSAKKKSLLSAATPIVSHTVAHQQSVHLNDRHSTVDEY